MARNERDVEGVLPACYPGEYAGWVPKLRELIPSVGVSLHDNPVLLDDVRTHFRRVLGLNPDTTLIRA